jgi:hypothetical protein
VQSAGKILKLDRGSADHHQGGKHMTIRVWHLALAILLLAAFGFGMLVLAHSGGSSVTVTPVPESSQAATGATTTTQSSRVYTPGDARIMLEKSAIIAGGKTGNDFIYVIGMVLKNQSDVDARDITVNVNIVDRQGTIIASQSSGAALIPAHATMYNSETVFTPSRLRPTSVDLRLEVGETGTGGKRPRTTGVRFTHNDQYFTVTGVLKNDLDHSVNGVVSAVLFDRSNNIIGSNVGGTEADTLPPGRKSLFTVDFIRVGVDPSRVAYVRVTPSTAEG